MMTAINLDENSGARLLETARAAGVDAESAKRRRFKLLWIGLMSLAFAQLAFGRSVTVVPRTITPNCEVHLVSDQGEQIVRCGEPTEIAARQVFAWIETTDLITPYLTDVSQGGTISIDAGVPSAKVLLDKDSSLGPGETVRVISTTPATFANDRSRFERLLTTAEASLRMPAGGAFAVVLNAKGKPIALQRLVTLDPTKENILHPAQPDRGKADLALSLALGPQPGDSARPAFGLSISDSSKSRSPDILLIDSKSALAIWYGLGGKTDRLVLDSSTLRLAHDSVSLSSGALEWVDDALLPLPSLTITVSDLPRDAAPLQAPLEVTISPRGGEKVIRRQAVALGHTYVVDSLPAMPLEVTLASKEINLTRRVDLSSGADGSIVFQLQPLVLSGTVYAGDTPVPAQLKFEHEKEPSIATSDDSGRYSVTLWSSGRYVVEASQLDHPEVPPFQRTISIETGGVVDIRIPVNALSVHVFDSATGKGVPGAKVGFMNRWSDESGNHSAAGTIDADGEVTRLPPQHPGTVVINVGATHFKASAAQTIAIQEGTQQTIEVPLQKESKNDHNNLQLWLNNSTPAAGAELATWDSQGHILWTATSDESGLVSVPDEVRGTWMLVRHPLADTGLMSLAAGADDDTPMFLNPTSTPPLLVTVVHKDQTNIGSTPAMLTIWVYGRRLTGDIAAFATWSQGMTEIDGTWTGRQLPVGAVRVLFTRNTSTAEIGSGTLDSLSTPIPFPWSSSNLVTLGIE